MIPQIKEINFPEYTTLSTATASSVDMGDKTITAQVKIDGSIVPDFSYDWEIEFRGERYIQPLRKPQASKSNESISSIIDLTFYHKGIYNLKRYFFVSTVELDAGTLMADNYIVHLRLNIAEFVDYLNNVLKYYYGYTYKVFLNPDYEYDETDIKDIEFNYTKIWDVITHIYEWFGVRWTWATQQEDEEYYSIYVGYPSTDVSHTFEYGFEGGLLKFERQVQNAEIANVVFGRGSSSNIPLRYFKNKSESNPTFPADPDWIPELEDTYFANLRGKTFRDYVQGWKTNPNRNTLNGTLSIEPLDEIKLALNYAYRRGHEDSVFAPIEYVKDDSSIAQYGEIPKGLEHNEEIKPTIQGVTIDGIGRVDQIVDVEPILVDESTENTEVDSKVMDVDITDSLYLSSTPTSSYKYPLSGAFTIPSNYKGNFIKDFSLEVIQSVKCTDRQYSSTTGITTGEYTKTIKHPLNFKILSFNIVDASTQEPLDSLVEIAGGTRIYIEINIEFSNFFKKIYYVDDELLKHGYNPSMGDVLERTPKGYFNVHFNFSWELDYTPIHGQILGNYESGAIRKSQTVTIASKGRDRVVFTTEQFTISEKNAPATSVEMPYRITSSLKGGEYDPRPNVVAIDVNTGEIVSPINLPAGTYYLQNSIQIDNFASKQQTFKVELLPTYIYYSYDSESWKPTFDIWVKNIWQTMPEKLESDYAYERRIWDAILGNHLGDEAKVVFSSGVLSGHSDWEFIIADTPKRDTSKTIDGVPSEWRITLYKSDAEMEATDKWLPSIMTQASAGDHFYFVGIEMPHQYVLWAEERLDAYKREELSKVSDVSSSITIQLDKVRMNELREGEFKPLLDFLQVGQSLKVADSRFIKSQYEALFLQSITYTWDSSTIMLPNIEVVLSNEILKSADPFKAINSKLEAQSSVISNTLPTIGIVKRNVLKAKASIAKTNAHVASTESTALRAQTLASQASEEVNANKDALFIIQKEVKTLIGEGLTDTNKSVREIATEVASEVIPTQVATAPKLKVATSATEFKTLSPNIVYDYASQSLSSFSLPPLFGGNASFDNRWTVRVALGSSSALTLPTNIRWKDGVAPSWSSWCICELTFRKDSDGSKYYGEWSIYK